MITRKSFLKICLAVILVFTATKISAGLLNKSEVGTGSLGWIQDVLAPISNTISAIKNIFTSISGGFESWIAAQADTFSNNPSLIWQILFAFLAGLSVSLTPCIYPLIPITLGILGSKGKASGRQQLARAISYLLGIAVVFGALGFLAIYFNLMFGSWLGNKWLISFIVAMFSILALHMLDLIDFEFSFFTVNAPEVSSVFSAFFYGMVTGLITSPCMTPALFTLLGFIAQKNDPFLGFILLFSFALGMTFLIILFSGFSTLLLKMPKPGSWMIEIRHLIGFGILFLCINFLKPILSQWQIYLIQSLLWFFLGLFYFSSSKRESVSKIIFAHRNRNSIEDNTVDIGFSEFISFNYLWKKTLSIIAVFLGVYFAGKTYLTYKKTTPKKVLIKMLK